jgi:hypothetical protein
MKKATLSAIILSTIGLLSAFGCAGGKEDPRKYTFKGRIGDEIVDFTRTEGPHKAGQIRHTLSISQNGLTVKYWDKDGGSKSNADMLVDCVIMTQEKNNEGNKETQYCKGDVDDAIFAKAQKEFDIYLKKITEQKTKDLQDYYSKKGLK